MNTSTFIVTLEPYEQFNCKGESMGMSEKLAVCYLPSLCKKRYYRNSYANPKNGLKLLTFKSEKEAQLVCDLTNDVSGKTWKIEKLNVDDTSNRSQNLVPLLEEKTEEKTADQ